MTAAFELIREQEIPEASSLARLYRHTKTGAEVLSLINEDENKVFGITFRTPPSDDTGIAHILEHSVLCGSEKFPVKKPFVEMLKGSLQTFLNAMTFPDMTTYPVASQNVKDFYNLVDVYLDAVFFPLITEDTFRQEGWHYERDGGNAPLAFRGVVFNEMKGAYSSPDALLRELSQLSLYPDNAYGVNSGGDPAAIPDLTYEQFRAFHAKHYHPSNARILFYGDDDPAQRLVLLEDYLDRFEARPEDTSVAVQPKFEAPRRETHTYAASEGEDLGKASFVTVNWMLDEVTDRERALSLSVLEHVLVGTSAAPLRKALTDSGLGEGLTGSGIVEELRQPMFTVGLKGIAAADADKVEALILNTLKSLAEDGIDPEAVEASLNTVEFALRENNTGSFPRGISVMLRALRTWLHDRDPLEPLAFETVLQDLKARAAAGERVFEPLIAELLVGNPHRTTVVLNPDPGQAAREAAAERARLDAAAAAMSPEELERVEAETRALKALQEAPDAPEDLAKIPTLALSDLPRENRLIPIETGEIGGATLLTHDLATNGIVYLDVGFDLRALPDALLAYLPLFSRALVQTGTAKEDFVSLSRRIGRLTGGVSPTRWISASADGAEALGYLFVRAKAVPERVEDMLAILSDVLLEARLDNRERLKQLALEAKARFESRLTHSGHSLVGTRLRAGLHASGRVSELTEGLSHLNFLRELIARIDRDWEGVHADLERIRESLIGRHAMVVNVTADADTLGSLTRPLQGFIAGLDEGGGAVSPWTARKPARSEGLTIPAKVNYVGKGADLHALGYPRTGATGVVLRHLSTTWLWDKVRVQGGAYGGSASYDPYSGSFVFFSYRDPNLIETLDAYDGAAGFLRQGMSAEALKAAIIGAIGTFDRYMLPDAKGYTSALRYLAGDSDEERQRRREEVLATSDGDVRAFADALDAVARTGRIVVLGSETAIRAANEERPGLLEVSKVM